MPGNDREDLAARVARVLAEVPRANGGLTRVHHVPALFADLAAGFDIEAFEARAFEEARLAPARLEGSSGGVYYQGDTSYHAWFDDDAEGVKARQGSPETFIATTRLPLPRWALELQQALLVALHGDGEFGWSAELFFSREGAASMGVHADNDDVFTVQLYGEKVWQVDPVSLERLDALEAEGRIVRGGPESAWHFQPGCMEPLRAPAIVVLKPGDLLATPAFAMHHVQASGPRDRSLSFNVSVCREQLWLAHQEKLARCCSPSNA